LGSGELKFGGRTHPGIGVDVLLRKALGNSGIPSINGRILEDTKALYCCQAVSNGQKS